MFLKDYRIRSFLSIQYVHGDLCKHLGKDSSTDHPDDVPAIRVNTTKSTYTFTSLHTVIQIIYIEIVSSWRKTTLLFLYCKCCFQNQARQEKVLGIFSHFLIACRILIPKNIFLLVQSAETVDFCDRKLYLLFF